jgi:RimJ/RimL family protein N-acetyltransferase
MSALWTPPTVEQRDFLLRWTSKRLDGISFDPATSLPVAVMHGDRIVCVVVYHQHRGSVIEMSNAADTPRWATQGVIAQLLATPFVALNCRLTTAIVRSDNTRARKFDEGIGFRYLGTMPDAFEDCDAILYGLTRAQWLASRWHKYWLASQPQQEVA